MIPAEPPVEALPSSIRPCVLFYAVLSSIRYLRCDYAGFICDSGGNRCPPARPNGAPSPDRSSVSLLSVANGPWLNPPGDSPVSVRFLPLDAGPSPCQHPSDFSLFIETFLRAAARTPLLVRPLASRAAFSLGLVTTSNKVVIGSAPPPGSHRVCCCKHDSEALFFPYFWENDVNLGASGLHPTSVLRMICSWATGSFPFQSREPFESPRLPLPSQEIVRH